MKNKLKNHGKAISEEEVGRIKKFYIKGDRVEDIASKQGRTVNSCYRKVLS